MQVSKLYIYPIKCLRECEVNQSDISKFGLHYDRRFMLLKVEDGNPSAASSRTYENMHIMSFPKGGLFLPSVTFPKDDQDEGSIVVTFNASTEEKPKSITIPLQPSTAGLETIDVTMHKSPTKAYNMGHTFNSWFSLCFGFEVVLVYLGEHSRAVLMSTAIPSNNSWLSSIQSQIPFLGSKPEENRLTFSDCAPVLVVTEESLDNASSRMSNGDKFDVTKFRPNIVISGATEAWEEDFWSELSIGNNITIQLPQSCNRCKSINVDYTTGQYATGEAGSMLKKLQKDRRVDKGAKYSPVFGRYGFPRGTDGRISMGDPVIVKKTTSERSVFDWPGLTN